MNELLKKNGKTELNLNDINEIASGKWQNYTPTQEEINAAKKLAANDGKLAKELDRIGGVNGSLNSRELNPEENKPRNGRDWWSFAFPAKAQDFETEFSDPQSKSTAFTNAINSIKFLTGNEHKEYLSNSDIWKAYHLETDPGRRELYSWIAANFDAIDAKKNKDGFIGAGDLEKWFNYKK